MIYSGVVKKIHMGRIPYGEDLLNAFQKIVERQEIKWGTISCIGAVKNAKLGFFDQQSKKYHHIFLDEELEITNGTGNISIKDGKPFIHLHLTVADSQARAIGGHVQEGTTVFICEFWITELDGPPPQRLFDQDSSLFLWKTE